MARLGELGEDFASLGAEVVAVSCDSRLTHAAWKQATGYTTRLVTDFWPHGEIARAHGVFDERLGVAVRATFVMDADGIVRQVIHQPEMARARDVDAYLDAVRQLGTP